MIDFAITLMKKENLKRILLLLPFNGHNHLDDYYAIGQVRKIKKLQDKTALVFFVVQ